jgi:hypothetical protein
MYLLEPKGGEGGRSVVLFYCLILSDTLAIVAVSVARRGERGRTKNKTTAKSVLYFTVYSLFRFSVITSS